MEMTYLEMKAITDMLDEHSWGILYPVYQLYLELKGKYRRFKREQKRKNMKALRATATA